MDGGMGLGVGGLGLAGATAPGAPGAAALAPIPPPVRSAAGQLEEKLVSALTTPSGMRLAPGKDDLAQLCVKAKTLDLQLLLMLFCSTLEDAAVVWQVPLPHTPSSPPDRPFFLLSLSISLYLSPQPPSLLSISSPEVLCCSLHVQVRKRV
eukprot:Tamp_28017.p1 GENE.Tamp_28017~~Tamp_28017.p1  ORF type:complete len:151 (-),score=15.81 Tamp_28017:377-829(-)